MANQPTPTKPATIKDVIVPGNNESGCTRACNGNSTCGGVCGGQCYKQVHTNPRGVDTVMGYSCRGTGEIVDPLPRPLPKTIAALLSTIGSPQFDAFEGGGFITNLNSDDSYYLLSVDDSKCQCQPSGDTRNPPAIVTGCIPCFRTSKSCYSVTKFQHDAAGRVIKTTASFMCLGNKCQRRPAKGETTISCVTWPAMEYRGGIPGLNSGTIYDTSGKPIEQNIDSLSQF